MGIRNRIRLLPLGEMVVLQLSSLSPYPAHTFHSHQNKPLTTSPKQCSSLLHGIPLLSRSIPKSFNRSVSLLWGHSLHYSFLTRPFQPCILCLAPQEHIIIFHHAIHFLQPYHAPAKNTFLFPSTPWKTPLYSSIKT